MKHKKKISKIDTTKCVLTIRNTWLIKIRHELQTSDYDVEGHQ